MKSEQVNIRLEADLLARIQGAADDEHLERGTMIRKLMLMGLQQYRLDRTLADYQALKISTGFAAQELGISDRKSTRLNSSHLKLSRMPSSA